MHELSIAMSLIEVAQEEAARVGTGARVQALHVRLGPLSGVVAEALTFSFEAAAHGTCAEGATLEIERTPIVVRCAGCGLESQVASGGVALCPACGAPAPEIVGGRECLLMALEIEEDDEDVDDEPAEDS